MDARGVRSMADIAAADSWRYLLRGRYGRRGASPSAGLPSSAGSATTGVYIDDVPIQSRSTGYGSGNVYPTVFDLERVEVLVWTAGHASSERGRKVARSASFNSGAEPLTTHSGVARAEISTIQNGDLGYEVGYATGGPTVQDKLGVSGQRILPSLGWLDRQCVGNRNCCRRHRSVGTGLGAACASGKRAPMRVNWGETESFRLAFGYAPTENITITPSASYNSSDYSNARQRDPLARAVGLQDRRDLVNVVWPATVDADRVALQFKDPTRYPFDDRFVLSALRVNWDMGPMTMISNTSYFDRDMSTTNDYTTTHVPVLRRPQGSATG